MNKTKVELTDTGIFVQILNPLTGRMEWKSQPEDYDYQQELARAAFADMLHDTERVRTKIKDKINMQIRKKYFFAYFFQN